MTFRLNKTQQAAKAALEKLLADHDEADSQYNLLAEIHDGRIISTDLARFLDKRYRDSNRGAEGFGSQLGFGVEVCPCSFFKRVAHRGKRKLVSFIDGGWGAGKTHDLEHAPVPVLTWDGTLQDIYWPPRG